MYGENLQPENKSYNNDVELRHRFLAEFAAENSNLSPGDKLFNATYGTGEHVTEATVTEIVGGMVEAKKILGQENAGLLVYLASEPPVRLDYKVVNRDGLYMLVDVDGIPYAVTKNAALLQKYVDRQAA